MNKGNKKNIKQIKIKNMPNHNRGAGFKTLFMHSTNTVQTITPNQMRTLPQRKSCAFCGGGRK